MGADLDPSYTSGRLHRQVKKIIEDSSQTLKNQNAFYLPTGDGKISFVDARDIAAVVVEVLTKKRKQA
jgi:uncharacterized protein YbjT (DUF2867 family)